MLALAAALPFLGRAFTERERERRATRIALAYMLNVLEKATTGQVGKERK